MNSNFAAFVLDGILPFKAMDSDRRSMGRIIEIGSMLYEALAKIEVSKKLGRQ